MDLIQEKLTSRGDEVYIGCFDIQDHQLSFLPNKVYYQIYKLILYDNRITSNGMLYFSQAVWPNLISLDLQENKIGNKGLKYLTRTKMSLEQLYIGSNVFDSDGLNHLIKAKWKNLKILNLSSNNLFFTQKMILNRSNWPNLQILDLENCEITIEQIKSLTLSVFESINEIKLSSNNYNYQKCYSLLCSDHKIFIDIITHFN